MGGRGIGEEVSFVSLVSLGGGEEWNCGLVESFHWGVKLPDRRAGDRAGCFSIRVNARWRICFEWREGNAWNVEIVDYH